MNRSIVFAFLCALLLHSVVALMDLNAFMSPSSVKISPKTLIMNIVVPQRVRKPSIDKDQSIVVKKPLVKERVIKKVKPIQKVNPKVNIVKGVQPDRSVGIEKMPEEDRIFSDLQTIAFPQDIKREDDFIEEYAFIPDMVDIPQAIPDINNTPKNVKKDEVPDVISAIPLTNAHPNYKHNISPPYPLLARKRGYQGTVVLEVLVSTDGKAASIRLSRSSGYSILDRAAIKGVRSWLFYPAKRGDELFEMWVKIPIRFTLN